ncbi:uncharacterized protein LOC103568779 [Microplitis demolitor]|uniref:uncharacterized protein LOC103568779 n=1 Tax=Microplitis demolitor TaxID=69319 RepID=UPI0004CDBBC4|nr:uncharacterized protein LOC103568779 [Microplitis demolitor]
MFTKVFVAAALICCIISQINSLPIQDDGYSKPPSYQEKGPLEMEMISPDGSEKILTPSEILSLSPQLPSNAKKVILYKLIDKSGNSYLLSDHQIERLLNFDVIAIISGDDSTILKRPGFGHLFVILQKDGTLKSFIYNLTLQDAVKQLPDNYPFNYATSKHAYHTGFQN